jgi:PEGA domain
MKKGSLVAILVLAVMLVGFLSAPSPSHAASGSLARLPGPTGAPFAAHVAGPAAAPLAPASSAPLTSYPRTVLVETFTGEWCIYCVEESQAFYAIDHNPSYGASVINIGELHICYSPSNCGDNYPTPDGTGNTRASYYNVQGFPTVFFDGSTSIVGAAPNLPTMETWYEQAIHNASIVPGNVSIEQSAMLASGATVTAQVNVTSSVTGTYHALSYLVEYIGKNDSSSHDIGNVVRSSLLDRTVSLTAGGTLQLTASGAIASGWNEQRLSVITFLQDNTTKIVENSNMVPVTNLLTGLSATPATVASGTSATVTVRALNSSTSAAVVGAAVTLTVGGGATLVPATGVTASDGTFTATFTAPAVTSVQTFLITAEVSLAGYTTGSATTSITVNPVSPPSVPLGLTITPWNQEVYLNWNAPASGGSGVTYHVFRSTSASMGFAAIAVSTSTVYIDAAVADGQSYWYTVDAQNAGGFSANATAIAANAVTATTQGLPANVGWWLSIDSMLLSSPTDGDITLHLPDGTYDYQIGAGSYGFVPTSPDGSVSVAGTPAQVTAAFSPRYATLEGTVTPAGATVTVDGTNVPVVGGAFHQSMVAGTYVLNVTSQGYRSESTTVTLTAGNTTTVPVTLHPLAGSGSGSSLLGGLSGEEVAVYGAVAAVIAIAAVVGALRMLRKPKGLAAPTSEDAEDGSEGSSSPRSPPSEP